MDKQIVSVGIQECRKCKYKLRCEECVYNEKDIRILLDQARKQAVKEFAERLKRRIYSGFYSWQSSMTYEKFCKVEREALLIDEIAKEFGVEL